MKWCDGVVTLKNKKNHTAHKMLSNEVMGNGWHDQQTEFINPIKKYGFYTI